MNQRNIIGKWKTVSLNLKEYQFNTLEYEMTENCIEEYTIYNFNSDGTGQEVYYTSGTTETHEIIWVVVGDKLIVSKKSGTETTITYNV